jgi:hypothetical protein
MCGYSPESSYDLRCALLVDRHAYELADVVVGRPKVAVTSNAARSRIPYARFHVIFFHGPQQSDGRA